MHGKAVRCTNQKLLLPKKHQASSAILVDGGCLTSQTNNMLSLSYLASCKHWIPCKRGSRAAGALTSFPRASRLRDDSRSNKEVLGYLEAENEYADAYFAQLQPLVDSLADSMSDALPAVEVGQVRLCSAHASSSSRSVREVTR